MDLYLGVNVACASTSLYFIIYCAQRIVYHWRDGKERARTSGGRLIVKIASTISCSILEFIHMADYMPGHFSEERFIIRSIYFATAGSSWMCSSFLVYFDYTRRLKSQWQGQRTFWISQLFINSGLLLFNILTGNYTYYGEVLYQFDLIQIISYSLSILLCLLLSFYSIFRPNDFSMVSADLFAKLKRSAMLFDDTDSGGLDEEIVLTASIAGYKSKEVQNSFFIKYNINITINEKKYCISRSLSDFEALDKALREKFPRVDFPNLKFPEFSVEILRKCNTEERGTILGKYLSFLCKDDFMTPDLLNFLQIEGNYRDLLSYKYNLLLEERYPNSDSVPRAESKFFGYYSPNITPTEDIDYPHIQGLMWLINVSIPSYRYDEQSKILDYYVKTEIQALGSEKFRAYKFSEFCDLHKTLKKVLSPGPLLPFPSKNYGQSFTQKDKLAIEARKIKLEIYLSQILNDPAYLCRESLDFFGCDANLHQILDLIPSNTYRITEEMTWEGDISDDSSHYILFCMYIGKTSPNSTYEKQWRISRRYREFDVLHKKLVQRQGTSAIKNYLTHCGKQAGPLPNLPPKTIAPLSTLEEIEERKRLLEIYIKDLLANPSVTCSFPFREFLREKD